MPDRIDAVEELVEVGVTRIREVRRSKLHALGLQCPAGERVAPRAAHRVRECGQVFGGISAEAAGGARDQGLHRRMTIPPTVRPAAVPISMRCWPAPARPVTKASCSAVGMEAATWLPCVL